LDTATETKTVVGETHKLKPNPEADIIEHLWWMKKQGYSEVTIVGRDRKLRRFVTLGADLNNPESIKEVIANQTKWQESQKETMVNAYDLYRKCKGLTWQKPRYKAVRQLPFIPQEKEIDELIASCTDEISVFLQIAKESGARAGEIYRLLWKDIDFEARTISITAEKGSNPRLPRISSRLFNMLSQMLRRGDKIFCKYKSVNTLRRTFDRQRKRTAYKLANPRLKKITFHTLRHWKGTSEYHKTKDILHVMQVLGHKNIKNTLLYTQLISVEQDDQFTCKVAKTPKEIQDLIELGYEHVCTKDDFLFFRKRK
jgi:integrase